MSIYSPGTYSRCVWARGWCTGDAATCPLAYLLLQEEALGPHPSVLRDNHLSEAACLLGPLKATPKERIVAVTTGIVLM